MKTTSEYAADWEALALKHERDLSLDRNAWKNLFINWLESVRLEWDKEMTAEGYVVQGDWNIPHYSMLTLRLFNPRTFGQIAERVLRADESTLAVFDQWAKDFNKPIYNFSWNGYHLLAKP